MTMGFATTLGFAIASRILDWNSSHGEKKVKLSEIAVADVLKKLRNVKNVVGTYLIFPLLDCLAQLLNSHLNCCC